MVDLISFILAILAALNVISFIFVGLDKQRSLRPGAERFSEVSFFFIAVFFASLGIFLGMLVFRHKTRKAYFMAGMALLAAQQALLVNYLANWLAHK